MQIYSLNKENFSVLGIDTIVPEAEKSLFLVTMTDDGEVVCVLQYYPESLATKDVLTFVSIQTEAPYNHKGYATKLLDYFFENIVSCSVFKKLQVTSYSLEGELFMQPAIKKYCQKTGVDLIEESALSNFELIRLYSQKGC